MLDCSLLEPKCLNRYRREVDEITFRKFLDTALRLREDKFATVYAAFFTVIEIGIVSESIELLRSRNADTNYFAVDYSV